MAERRSTALVTGATGFVGSHLVEELARRGVAVRCFLRERSSEKWLPPSELLEIHRGSFDDPAALERAAGGVDAIYHLAAATSAPSEAAYFRANLHSTRKLVDAARSAAPQAAFLLCSSQAAAGPARHGRPVTEADEPRPITSYGRSKLEAERLVLDSGLRAVVVRPPTVYGPRDRDIFEMFRWAARGLAPLVGTHEQRLSLVHVSDLVDAMIAASAHASGTTYFVTDGQVHTRSEIVEHIARSVERQSRRIHVPVAAAMTLARVYRLTARIAGVKPLLTPERIMDFCEADWTCDDSRARAELGYHSKLTIEQGLLQTARWYREHGWI